MVAPEAARVSARVQVVAITAVAMLMAAAVTFGWLIHARRPLVSTDSVAPRFPVAALRPNQPLCVRRLPLPAVANAVEMEVQTGAVARLELRLSAGGREQLVRTRVPGSSAGKVSFPIRPSGRALPARACLTSSTVLPAVLGFPGGSSPTTTIGGDPLNADVAVWFLKLPGRHLLSALPKGPQRAALFRAGFVGPWTYWALLGVIPLMWLVVVRLQQRSW